MNKCITINYLVVTDKTEEIACMREGNDSTEELYINKYK